MCVSVYMNFNHIFMHIHMYVVSVTSYLCVRAHVTLGELSYRTILECISYINYLDAAIMLIN